MKLCRYLPVPSDRMGVLWSLLPIENSVILEYGPAGTTHYSMGLFNELGLGQRNRLFTTHMSEADVVMGDTSRLEKALVEIDQQYKPQVIFVLASTISAVIGTDLRGVCAYTQKKVNAQLVVFPQISFSGDYSTGLQSAYKALAEQLAEADQPRIPGTYNLLGVSEGAYRMRSDVNEIKWMMHKAFGMRSNVCLCEETSVEKIRRMGGAEVNLVLREEALPAAQILEKRCGTPYVLGAPYGYTGSLNWLQSVGTLVGRSIEPALQSRIEEQTGKVREYRRTAATLKRDKPCAVLYGEYPAVEGLSAFMKELGISVSKAMVCHSLRAYSAPAPDVQYLPQEQERMSIMQALHHTLVLADDVSRRHIASDNSYLRISMPVIDGAQIATHLPLMGVRGADAILETVEAYFQTLR